jgi:hypothetical protein
LVDAFSDPVEKAYREILAAVKKREPDLAALGRRYQAVLSQDYFKCDLGPRVRQALLSAQGDGEL